VGKSKGQITWQRLKKAKAGVGAKQNAIATKYNDLATKFNALLTRLETQSLLLTS